MTKYLNITETGQKLVEWSEQMTDEPIIITKEGQPWEDAKKQLGW